MSIANKVFKFYSDPGHGWLAVKVADLTIVDLTIAEISGYSYCKGATVYLEEDFDASRFIKNFTEKYGHKPKYQEKSTNNSSPIRSYSRIFNN